MKICTINNVSLLKVALNSFKDLTSTKISSCLPYCDYPCNQYPKKARK